MKVSTLDVVSLVLSNARAMSKRAAFGWALLDRNNRLIVLDAVIAGTSIEKITESVELHATNLDHIILSQEPSSSICGLPRLLSALDHSTCDKITIAHQPSHEYRDVRWPLWMAKWRGSVDYTRETYAGCSLALGIETAKQKHRPWVTVVSASDFAFRSVDVCSLFNEFGAKVSLASLIRSNRALLYTKSQASALSELPINNNMDEPIEQIEVEDMNNLTHIFRHCVSRQCYSVMMLADLPFLSGMHQSRQVDEIVHHVTGRQAGTPPITSALAEIDNNVEGLDLSGWLLTSCSPLGNCCQMVWREKFPDGCDNESLKRWLN